MELVAVRAAGEVPGAGGEVEGSEGEGEEVVASKVGPGGSLEQGTRAKGFQIGITEERQRRVWSPRSPKTACYTCHVGACLQARLVQEMS